MIREQHEEHRTDTRERLLLAALETFGHRDYDAVSTREIVDRADANISAISYHFGGKQPLYLATARFLATALGEDIAPAIQAIRARIDTAGPDECRKLLAELIEALVSELLLGRLSDDAAGFIFREQHNPTAAFDILYRDLMEPLQSTYAILLGRILGESPHARDILLMTHALMGQILAFRMAQTTILRRLQASRLDTNDVADIGATITRLTLAAITQQTTPGHRP